MSWSPPSTSTAAISLSNPALAHLSPSDRTFFLTNGVGPTRPTPFSIVHHAIEHQVRLNPSAIAVEHALYNHQLSYGDLDIAANRLSRRLRNDFGIGPGQRVCILARRSIYLVMAIVGVLKSGAQYVPIDAVTVTDATLAHILGDSKPGVVLVMEEYEERLEGRDEGRICLERVVEEDERNGADGSKMEPDLTKDSDGCYVIYTSGTTGTPKGVDVRHNGAANVICAPPGNVHMRPGMRVAQLLNIAFDMGAWEILSSLYNGCTLCLRGNTSKEWAALMKSVDVVISTPSILARHDPKDYTNLKHVIVGGEVCPQALADNWATYTQFNNCCGPTEISICNTIQPHTPGYPLSIGKPIPNTNVYILDPTWSPLDPESVESSPYPRPMPIGQVGLMYVGGMGVSRGYLNLPEKSKERYVPDPFLGEGWMMFNTGDLGRWREDGQIEHCGRKDEQVKVKGFRVELDGVGEAMRGKARDSNCASTTGAGANGVEGAVALLVREELWGFVTPEWVDLEAVRKVTAKTQPYYAVPSRWVAMKDFPMTRNGKVDKRALRDIAEAKLLAEQQAKERKKAVDMMVSVVNERTLKVPNGGVPFSASMPGTPMYLQLGHGQAKDATSPPPTPGMLATSSSAEMERSSPPPEGSIPSESESSTPISSLSDTESDSTSISSFDAADDTCSNDDKDTTSTPHQTTPKAHIITHNVPSSPVLDVPTTRAHHGQRWAGPTGIEEDDNEQPMHAISVSAQ